MCESNIILSQIYGGVKEKWIYVIFVISLTFIRWEWAYEAENGGFFDKIVRYIVLYFEIHPIFI